LLMHQQLFSQKTNLPAAKKTALESVDNHQAALTALSDSVWNYAEPALKEYQSSKLLSDYAEKQGFKVTRNIAGLPTAFIAEYGSGKPIIGVLGEFDALPGLSQKAETSHEALKEGAAGHGCGHNLLGVGGLGAALAIKELMEKNIIKGTIRFYGTPAEEDYGGKLYMAREGVFNDLDVCLDWHPDYETKVNNESSQAMADYTVSFSGKSAHAASDPWDGRSALDAAELFNTGINFYREHVKPSVRMHYVYLEAGKVPNVVPDKASVWIWLRDSKRTGVAVLEERMKNIAAGAALMAGVSYETRLNDGDYEELVIDKGAELLQKNLDILGSISYTPEEVKFANDIMKQFGMEPKGLDGSVKPLAPTPADPEGGSTDVGDISWIVPQISLLVTTAPYETPWHSWVVVACGGMSIGHKGMLYASKALAVTMIDLFQNPQTVTDIRNEFMIKKGNETWKAMLPPGPPVIRPD
jgi:aminobenzoyl-glutamate utilization protein B